jgi:gliding motility-associated-like protein
LNILTSITKFFLTLAAIFFVVSFATAQMEFVENKGQWDSRVNYRGDFTSGAFFLENKGFTVLLHNVDDLKFLNEVEHGTDSVSLAKSASINPSIPSHSGNGGSACSFPSVTVRSHAYKVSFLGASNNAQVVPDKILPTYNNYFLGNDKSKWAGNCKIYYAVTYKNVYPNIDVRYYTEMNQLKYDLIVRPGGNPNAIAMRYDGADKLETKNRELIIGTSVGEVKELYPFTYQSPNGKRAAVDCKYVVKDNVVTFKVSHYDPTQTLIIDPALIFSSFTGSPQENWGYTATPGPDGSLYAAGIAFGSGYPVSPGAFQTGYGGGVVEDNQGAYDIAIFKFSANGTQRVYATYLGGRGNEQPHSLICDAQGDLIVAGRSNSKNFPVTRTAIGSGNATASANYDIIITKFNASGTGLLGSVTIGGSGDDGVNIKPKYSTTPPDGAVSLRRNYGDDARSEVILDGADNILLASCTQSADFPVISSPIQTSSGGLQDGVILKLSPNLSSVFFTTYFGGGGDDACFVISINPVTNNLYVAGATTSTNLPGDKIGAMTTTNQGGETDGYVTELMSDGSAIIKTTYQGTSGDDMIYGLKFDKFGFPYIMGTTTGNWPIVNATYSNTGGKQFISKLRPDLSGYVYSTIFGTNASEPNLSPIAFLVDRCQNVYVSGWGGGLNASKHYPTSGTFGLPEVNPLPNIPPADGKDFYFFVLEKNANSQLFGTHFGEGNNTPAHLGDHVDGGTSRFDANGIIYQAICACKSGSGAGTTFPTTPGVWSTVNRGSECNEAVVKIEMNFAGVGASVKATISDVIDTIGCAPLTIKFTDTLAKGKMYVWDYGDPASPKRDTTYAPNNSVSHTYSQVGRYRLMLIAIDSATCNIADTAFTHVKVGFNIVVPNFTFTKLDSCGSLRFRFDNTTTALLPNYTNQTFVWDFGDGSPRIKTGFTSQIHTFPATGSYNVRLVVDDTSFCNSPDSTQKTVRINPNVKAIFNTPNRGCVPYTPVFNNLSLGGLNWLWDLGDGTSSTDFEPIHIYNQVGSYNVRLIAYDSTTCNKVDTSAYFTISVYPIPTAGFTWSPNPPVENTRTVFTNLSVGATRYLWDFGDGATSTDVNPVHQYNKTDTFNVTLAAFNDADCSDTFPARIPIIIRPLLDVPNAFTPGRFAGSAYNNGIVKVEGFGIGKMIWKIYNRWGQVVFSTTDINQGWDGTYKGVLSPMDVYAYTLDVEFTDGKKLRKTGDITLLR